MGEMVICSKSIIKGVMKKTVQIWPILLKTWTQVEFSGQNYDNNRNIRDSMTIALWENIDNQIKHFPRNNDKRVVYVNTGNKKLK